VRERSMEIPVVRKERADSSDDTTSQARHGPFRQSELSLRRTAGLRVHGGGG
jgi:hypothetical protein